MRRPPLVPSLTLLVAMLLLAGCGGSSSSTTSSKRHANARDASSTQTATSADSADSASTEDTQPIRVPDPVAPGDQAPIVIASPLPFTTVVGTMRLSGTATTHEGSLAWAILGADLKPLAQGHFAASCGAPCRGRYSLRIPLATVPIGSWELHVWTPNVADGGPARLHDTMVPITVSDRMVAGAPAPGAAPPGGPPP